MADQFSLEDREDAVRLRNAWQHVLKTLAEEVTPTVMERFLKPLAPKGLANGVATFDVPGQFVLEWVREKFIFRLQDALTDELGENVQIELRAKLRDRGIVEMPPAMAGATVSQEVPKFRPNERYRFETFVVGQSNRMAFAGAKAVANEPGSRYNPLFIYGPSGVGKTHLLHAVAHELMARDPRFGLTYITAQQFAEQFVQALQTGRIEQFRRAQRNVGVWLVDDIQFVAGKDKTQEELFHTFNSLQQTGKQIVLCSDRPPRELFLMDERLRSRFEAGLVADIQPPDTETRCAILLSKAQHEGIRIPHEVAACLAENVPGNVRVLEGALTKVAAISSVDDVPIDLHLAEEVVRKYYETTGFAKPGFNQIVDVVGKYYKIPSDHIKGISRKAPITHARHVAVYITREITGDSWKHIGTLFGDRDHTSMMHAYQKISEMMARDRDLQSAIKMLIRNLHPDN
jgi:chromosomal replication initiator protein